MEDEVKSMDAIGIQEFLKVIKDFQINMSSTIHGRNEADQTRPSVSNSTNVLEKKSWAENPDLVVSTALSEKTHINKVNAIMVNRNRELFTKVFGKECKSDKKLDFKGFRRAMNKLSLLLYPEQSDSEEKLWTYMGFGTISEKS